MTLAEHSKLWVDEEGHHKMIHELFCVNVNEVEWMKEYRDFIEANVFGFGERSFLWLWKLIVDEMPSEFSFCEVGIFRGQILTLIKMLASASGRYVTRYGVTPLDERGIDWVSDYGQDIEKLHDTFFVPKDYTIYKGSSTDTDIIEHAYNTSPYDLLYVDGSHKYEDVVSDLKYYAPMVKRGGYLLIDDCAVNMKQPWGYFQGIAEVQQAFDEWKQTLLGQQFEFVFNVVHLIVLRRK